MTSELKGLFPSSVKTMREAYVEAETIAHLNLEQQHTKAIKALTQQYAKAKCAISGQADRIKATSDVDLYMQERHKSIQDLHFSFTKSGVFKSKE